MSDDGFAERLSFVQSVHGNLQNMIARADTKAGLLLATHGFLGISVAAPLVQLFPRMVQESAELGSKQVDFGLFVPTAIFALLFVAAFGTSLWLTTHVLSARGLGGESDGHRSLLFFEHIHKLADSSDQRHRSYMAALRECSDEDLVDDYAWSNCSLATITSAKMQHINKANRAFRRTVLAWIVILVWITLAFPIVAVL